MAANDSRYTLCERINVEVAGETLDSNKIVNRMAVFQLIEKP